MRLTIFSRLVIGYLAIFFFAAAVNVYSIMQLHQLKGITHSILTIDNRLIELEQKITDIFMSLIRNERKFIIFKDQELYDHFLVAEKEFNKSLQEMMSMAQTDEIKNLLSKIQEHKIHYQSLFDEEVKLVQLGQDYPREKYDQEKEQSINGITEGLKKLRIISQHVTYSKIKDLDEAESSAIKVALWMTIISLVFVIIISTFITFHITKPLSLIERKTRDIAKGDFKSDLNLDSPPEIKELAQAVNYMCAKLKEIDKMKSDFFSLMSHELRTPLTSIKEGTNLLIEGLQDGKVINRQERILTIIAEESNRLIKLVNSLMDISRMEAGMMKYHFTRADLVSMIDKVIREMEPLAETKNIKFKTKINEGLPSLKIDVERILQVMRNLLGNAVKFTPKGGKVLVSAIHVEKGIKVSVEDTGVGIKKEDLTSIFDKFQQVILPNSSKTIGTGLGLSIVKHIIKAHGGKVWAESTFKKGSIFTFVLPVS